MSPFDQLIQTLTDTTQPSIVRSGAIAGLVAQSDTQSIKFLVEALADSDSLIRREAAKALQNLDATSATGALLRALQSEAKDLTLWAMLEAISELGTPNDLPVLESLLKVDSMLTRIEIKKSIARIQERYPGGIITTLPAADPETADDGDEKLDTTESLLRAIFKRPRTAKEKNKKESRQVSAQEVQPSDSQQPPEVDTPSDKTGAETAPDETDNNQQPHVHIKLTSQGPPINRDDETLEQTDAVDDTDPISEPADVIDETKPIKPTRTFTNLFDDSNESTLTDSEDVEASADDTQFVGEEDTHRADASDEVTTDKTEIPDMESPQQEDDTETRDTESPQRGDETEIPDTESSQQEDDTETSDTESPQQEDDTDIRDLSDTISGSPRLAGSSVSLPVLAPNAATVPYHPIGTAVEPAQTNLFLALLHPSKYLSKQWLSRTRVYLILWGILIAAVVGFTQHQKHFRNPTPLSRIGVKVDELPELVKRSLAEGDFHIQEGYYRKAISSYELSRKLGTLPLDFYRKLGFAYFMEGQYALAIEAYELFLKAREELGAPDAFTAEASFSGVQSLTSIGKGTTQDYETYNILGTAYAKLGRVLDAQRTYEKAIHLAPKYGEAYNNLARLYIDSYQHPLTAGLEDLKSSPKLRFAETLAYTAVTLNPNVAAYHNTLGQILSKRGQVNKAMKVLERAIDLQRDAVEPHYHLAKVALEANERKKAAEAIRNVFKLKPSFVRLHTNQQ